MSPLPEKNRIMLDFFNKIRYFFSTSARYNCAFNQHKKFHPFFQLYYPSSAFTHATNAFIFIHPALPRPDG